MTETPSMFAPWGGMQKPPWQVFPSPNCVTQSVSIAQGPAVGCAPRVMRR